MLGLVDYRYELDGVDWPCREIGAELPALLGVEPRAWREDPGAWERHLHPDDRTAAVRERRDRRRERRAGRHEYRLLHDDGRVVWIDDRGEVVEQAGRVVERGVLVDVTAARERTALQRAFVEQLPGAIFYANLLDASDSTVFVSPQSEAVLGFGADGWTGPASRWMAHVHPEDAEGVVHNYERFLDSGSGVDEYRMVRPDGRVVWLQDRVVVQPQAGRVLGLMLDVTAQREGHGGGPRLTALTRGRAVERALVDLALGGASPAAIVARLAAQVGNPVVLEDGAGIIVESAGPERSLRRLRRDWRAHAHAGHAHAGHGHRGGGPGPGTDGGAAGSGDGSAPADATLDAGPPPCAWTTIRARRQTWGRLHAIAAERPLDEVDRAAVAAAGRAIVIALLTADTPAGLTAHAQASLVAELLRDDETAAVVARAREVGVDLGEREVCGLALLVGGDAARTAGARDDVDRALRAAGHAVLAATDDGHVLAIVGLDPGATGDDAARTALAVLGDDALAGLSEAGAAEDAGRALQAAREAAQLGARRPARGPIHRARELTLDRLLHGLGRGPDLAEFVGQELGPLLRHDARSRISYVETLRTYIEHSGRKTTTARALHLERRSLYHRLHRIGELIDADLDDADGRLRVAVALRALDLLGGDADQTGH